MKKHIKPFLSFLSLFLIISILLCFSSCGKIEKLTSEDKTFAAKAGEYEVPTALYNYFYTQYKKQYTGENDAESDSEDILLDEKIREDTKSSLINIYALYTTAAKYSVLPESDEIKAALDVYIEQFRVENSLTDDDDFMNQLKSEGMTYAVFRTLCEQQILEERLYNKLCENGEIIVSEKEAREKFDLGELVRVKHILVRYGEGEVTAKSIINTELLKETPSYLKASEAKSKLDAGADFDSLINEYGSDVSLFANKDGHYIVRGNKEISYEQAAFSLNVGEVSNIIETSEGFCIIKRLPLEDEYINENINSLIKDFSEGQFNLIIEDTAASLSFEYYK